MFLKENDIYSRDRPWNNIKNQDNNKIKIL